MTTASKGRWMPDRDERGPTEYAGKERLWLNQTVLLLDEGYEVMIFDYLKDLGLYVVARKDGQGPLFRVSPVRLQKIF